MTDLARPQRFTAHICALSRQERRDLAGVTDAPWRVHVNTRWWHFSLALRPQDKFANVDGTSDWTMTRRWPQ